MYCGCFSLDIILDHDGDNFLGHELHLKAFALDIHGYTCIHMYFQERMSTPLPCSKMYYWLKNGDIVDF